MYRHGFKSVAHGLEVCKKVDIVELKAKLMHPSHVDQTSDGKTSDGHQKDTRDIHSHDLHETNRKSRPKHVHKGVLNDDISH